MGTFCQARRVARHIGNLGSISSVGSATREDRTPMSHPSGPDGDNRPDDAAPADERAVADEAQAWLGGLDPKTANLDEVRAQMVAWITRLE